jgi:hypothetical protein
MNIFKKMFHKHESVKSSCPYTGYTYTFCKLCEKQLEQPVETKNG